ncbi:MAG: hydrogenase nickel incorporation protein HypA [Nitrospinae bacterium CG11_big_fil_rev_8_21_14_0_20_56_8]|nr:MAG: hydrogenase nickel incorporation protein HypA [Nitrospinae bacterium CG11_big_fil_rev_8_21_14_0_20_56_8]
MHEMSLMKDLMQKIDAVAQSNGARKVTQVRVQLGALCHMSAEHFKGHFVEAAQGTPAEGAALEIFLHPDEADPNAQDILLLSVDIEEP